MLTVTPRSWILDHDSLLPSLNADYFIHKLRPATRLLNSSHLCYSLCSDCAFSLVSQSGCSVTLHGLIPWGFSARLFLACSKTLMLSSAFIKCLNSETSCVAVFAADENSLKSDSAKTCQHFFTALNWDVAYETAAFLLEAQWAVGL